MAIYRKYKYPDGVLLEFASKTQGHFAKHHAAFARLDPELTEEWLADFVEAGKNASMDSFERTIQVQQTEDLMELIARFHAHFGLMEYYVSKAFDDNSAHKRYFDLEGYTDARRRQSDLIPWCRKFGQRLAENRDALLAAGAQEEFLAEVEQVTAAIDATHDAQEKSMDYRAAQTQERVLVFNRLFKALQRVEKLAGYVFPGEDKRLTFFKLPVYRPTARKSSGKGGSKDTTNDLPPEGDK